MKIFQFKPNTFDYLLLPLSCDARGFMAATAWGRGSDRGAERVFRLRLYICFRTEHSDDWGLWDWDLVRVMQ